MKFILFLFVLPFSLTAQTYSIIWSDEFDGSSVNTNKWSFEIGTGSGGWGNNELQYYTNSSNNVFVDTGYLHIVGRAEQIGNSYFSSARIKTQEKFDFTYGKVEARIKVPAGQGLWPAFWMLGSNITDIGWPLCGEIDIFEHVNNELIIYGTVHYDNWGYTYDSGQTWADATIFHTYAVEWEDDEIRWYIDGVEYHQKNIGPGTSSTEEFHNDFFLLLNLAIGGNWPGNPNPTTTFPATMMVDYVRVYQETNALDAPEAVALDLYPNPARETIIIGENVEIDSYSITDVLGNEVLAGSGNSVDISTLPNGMYLVEAQTTDGIQMTTSLVKQ